MDTIAEFYSQKEQIVELTEKLKLSEFKVRKWRSKYHKLNEKHGVPRPLSRTQKALILIRDKSKNGMLLKDIAAKYFLSLSQVESLSCRVNKEKK